VLGALALAVFSQPSPELPTQIVPRHSARIAVSHPRCAAALQRTIIIEP
jgi:hypothetical protein